MIILVNEEGVPVKSCTLYNVHSTVFIYGQQHI